MNKTRARISSCGTEGVEDNVIFGAEAGPLILTCAVMSVALASAMMSRTGSSFGLPSEKASAVELRQNLVPALRAL